MNVADKLIGRRHECDCVLRTSEAASPDGQAPVVVVIAKTIFPAPHGEYGASLHPAVEHRGDIEVGIRHKSVRIFPVVVEKYLLDGMCRLLAGEGWKRSVEHCIVHDVVAGLMILVPASLPVSHDDVRLVLADQVTNAKFHFFVVGNFAIRVSQKLGACAQHLRRTFRRLLLEDAILRRGNLS